MGSQKREKLDEVKGRFGEGNEDLHGLSLEVACLTVDDIRIFQMTKTDSSILFSANQKMRRATDKFKTFFIEMPKIMYMTASDLLQSIPLYCC